MDKDKIILILKENDFEANKFLDEYGSTVMAEDYTQSKIIDTDGHSFFTRGYDYVDKLLCNKDFTLFEIYEENETSSYYVGSTTSIEEAINTFNELT